MIKFLSTTTAVLIATVGFLYYLVQNSNFLPIETDGSYLLLNIVVFILIALVAILSFFILVIFALRQIFVRSAGVKLNIDFSIKYGALLAFGILVVYLLHFFHILGFAWGIAILIVVILSLFVI